MIGSSGDMNCERYSTVNPAAASNARSAAAEYRRR